MKAPRFSTLVISAIVFVVAFDLVVLWQWKMGAYQSEFGGHPDEAAHYVTGLLFHDYAAAGFPGSPQAYAETYYRHYPKIGLGMWPPGFYLLQASWMLVCGVGRQAMLLLMAAIAAVLALQVYRTLRREYGGWLAAIGGLLLLCQPLAVEGFSMIMAEMLSASLILAGAITWGRFLEQERGRDALIFGVLAGVATMVKGSGLALAIQAPLALAFVGKWRLLSRPAVWGGAALTAVIAGPWTWKFKHIGPSLGGWLEPHPSWHFTSQALPHYLGKFGMTFGPILVLLCAIGVLAKVRTPGPNRCFWAAMGALLISIPVFHLILPVGLEARHLIPAFPAVAMFVIAGFEAVRSSLRKRRRLPEAQATPVELAVGIVLLGTGIWIGHTLAPPDPKHWSGFGPIASAVLEDPAMKTAEILVSSDARGEGMFISELAMMEKRPGHVVRRVSKDLAEMDWEGRGVRLKYETDEALIDWFHGEGRNVGCVVVDATMAEARRGQHHDQIIQLVERHREMFWLVSSSPVVRGGVHQQIPLRLYQVRRERK